MTNGEKEINMAKVFIGTEIKLNINIEPIGNQTMDDFPFDVLIIGGVGGRKKSKTFSKKGDGENITLTPGLKRGDDSNNYIVAFNTSDIGIGKVICRIVAHLDDGDFSDRKRTEITEINTGIEVINGSI